MGQMNIREDPPDTRPIAIPETPLVDSGAEDKPNRPLGGASTQPISFDAAPQHGA